jgi:type I pantothenate kinase
MTVQDLVRAVLAMRPAHGTFIVGITGSVASGKSTLARALAPELDAELAATDGFLLPNAVLDARGLTARKGFPESYDLAQLARTLTAARSGPASFPAYSHVTYDVDPAAARVIDRPDVLLVEGLALGLDRPPPPGLIDCLIYLDAPEAQLEAWFVTRFMAFWEAAEHDPASFYARFRGLDRAGAEALAHAVWGGINLPNLRDYIAPVRAHADLIAVKGADHTIVDIVRGAAEPRP